MRFNLGIRRRLAPLLDNDRGLIELANSLLFSLPGTPIIYYGDEIGMGDDIWLPDRNGVRTPMQWDASRSAGFSNAARLYSPVIDQPPYDYHSVNVASQRADPASLWYTIRSMVQLHKQYPALGEGSLTWIDNGNNAVLAFYRIAHNDRILAIHNLSRQLQHVELVLPNPPATLTDLFKSKLFSTNRARLDLDLTPHQYLWLI